MVFGMLKIVGRHIQEASDDREIGFRHALQAFAFHQANGSVNDGFGCETMEIIFEAEDPNRAFNHLIDVVCRIIFSEDLDATVVRIFGRTDPCMSDQFFIWISIELYEPRVSIISYRADFP